MNDPGTGADPGSGGGRGPGGDDRGLTDRLSGTLREAGAALPASGATSLPELQDRYRRRRQRRRRQRLAAAGAAVVVLVVMVLGTGLVRDRGPHRTETAAGSAGALRMWVIGNTAYTSGALRTSVDAFNRSSPVTIRITSFSNREYKQLLQLTLGTADGPDIFVNWGGANLAEFVRADGVADLSGALRAHREVTESFLPEILRLGAVDGRQYGLPMSGVQPVVLYYNREIFSDAGLRPPETYDDLLTLVDAFRGRGITPIALPGAESWTELLYLMYLVDRIGGPGVFADVQAGRPGAWRAPAILDAARRCQELARRGAFGQNFDGAGSGLDATTDRFASGKAAMYLMGSWEYGQQLRTNPRLVNTDKLGWVGFPPVPGGAGDPRDLVGVPANFFSVAASSRHTDAATEFLVRTLTSDRYLDTLVRGGDVPAVRDAEPRLTGQQNADFTRYIHRAVMQAPSFTLAWDQALRPWAGDRLNDNVGRLFASRITPEEFVAAMAATA